MSIDPETVDRGMLFIWRLVLGLAKVFYQHDVRIIEVSLAEDKRSAVRGYSETSKVRCGLLQGEDWVCLTCCKVEKFDSPVWHDIPINEIDSRGAMRPVIPVLRMIQNVGFLTAFEWHLPHTHLIVFREI